MYSYIVLWPCCFNFPITTVTKAVYSFSSGLSVPNSWWSSYWFLDSAFWINSSSFNYWFVSLQDHSAHFHIIWSFVHTGFNFFIDFQTHNNSQTPSSSTSIFMQEFPSLIESLILFRLPLNLSWRVILTFMLMTLHHHLLPRFFQFWIILACRSTLYLSYSQGRSHSSSSGSSNFLWNDPHCWVFNAVHFWPSCNIAGCVDSAPNQGSTGYQNYSIHRIHQHTKFLQWYSFLWDFQSSGHHIVLLPWNFHIHVFIQDSKTIHHSWHSIWKSQTLKAGNHLP